VILLDLHMPGISGREAVTLLADEVPTARVLMLTVSEDADDLVDTLRAGASGYLLKNIETDALLDAIRRTAEGDAVVSPQMTRKLVQGIKSTPKSEIAPAPAEKDKLSPREREILVFVARGASNKEIARALDVAETTVKIHVQHILRKLDLTSRVQAAVYAVGAGLAENGKTG
jgi:two-component system nitrate/nitrite response regulator NarL